MGHKNESLRTTPGRYVPNGLTCQLWRCDACGFEGTTGTWRAHDGEKGHWCCKCREHGVKSPLRTIVVDDVSWEPGSVEIKCCGQWVACHGFTNTCHRCGRDYNGAGQELADRRFWGEETGESAGEIMAGGWA